MRWLFLLLLLPVFSFGQWKDYKIINGGDTVNRVDQAGKKQQLWVVSQEALRGEPGFMEEGEYVNDRKEGEWKVFSLMGDLIAVENYRWGFKDGLAQYYTPHGNLRMEQRWKALNPDKLYDTIQVEDTDRLDSFHEVVVKNEGASLKHGEWTYYDVETGSVIKTESYTLGKLSNDGTASLTEDETPKKVEKPREVLDFEKRKGKKKIRFQDGSTN